MKRVAQICNLLYRRIVFGRAWTVERALEYSPTPQAANLRCGKFQIRAAGNTGLRKLAILIVFAFGVLAGRASEPAAANQTTVIIVVGAPGEPEFGTNFVRQAALWAAACQQAHCPEIIVGLDSTGQTTDFDRLKTILAAEPKSGPNGLWLVMIGHGTFDGKEARFNLRGPDVAATDLALWLQPVRRPLAIINTSSSSAPFLNKLAGPNRVVITATRSGHEQNFTRFGQFLAETITDPQADLDKDGQVSLLEAFVMASRRTAEFYKLDGRIITEHALLDDSGDGLGTPADWFRGLRAAKRPREDAPVDGLLAQQFHLQQSAEDLQLSPDQRARRDELERAMRRLREKKDKMAEDDYYRELEKVLLELARLGPSNTPAGLGDSTKP